MRNLYFIINPQAKNGYCLKVWKMLESELERDGIPYMAFLTEYPGHAKEITELIAKKASGKKVIIAAVGGDGTLHEIVNGAMAYLNVQIGSIPGGSGNDFSRGFHIPSDPKGALRFLRRYSKETPAPMDIGKITMRENEERFFINNMGAGFDAEIAQKANLSKIKKVLNRLSLGRLVYVYILLKELVRFRCRPLELDIDGVKHQYNSTWFVTVSNQPYYGGGMKISPEADSFDGKLNITVVHNLSRIKLLFVFISVFWGGHVRFREVDTFTGRSISIYSPDPFLAHADGEIIGHSPLNIQVCPSALSVYTGQPGIKGMERRGS